MQHPQSMVKRRGPLVTLMMAILIAPGESTGQDSPGGPAQSIQDIRLKRLRTAHDQWKTRLNNDRRIVDLVCLVPDVPSFLGAVGLWDESHYFPILIEDVEYTTKFIRAFRPARIVRFNAAEASPESSEIRWGTAVSAVARAWTSEATPTVSGSQPYPKKPSTPGLVFSNENSETLAGAVALAAGRFQPLLRWDPENSFNDTLTTEQAEELARDVQLRVAQLFLRRYEKLGDDCDFLTFGLDYPYIYDAKGVTFRDGRAALDDLLGRHLQRVGQAEIRLRWAYTGRLFGTPVQSTYAAMCSLFLQPEQATLFNGYANEGPPWTQYRLEPVRDQLRPKMAVDHRADGRAGVDGWFEAMLPKSNTQLIMVNSSGGAKQFRTTSAQGRPWDTPLAAPSAIHYIHSFSAQQPKDSSTLAGRWLENGAFVYYGSAQEPFLSAFRTPELVASLLLEGLPFVAAARILPEELAPMGNCWRLVYFGDPVYRITETKSKRVPSTATSEVLEDLPAPGTLRADADPATQLEWSTRVGLEAARRDVVPPKPLAQVLYQLKPATLPRKDQERRDLLLADTLARQGRWRLLHEQLSQIGQPRSSVAIGRWLDYTRITLLQQAIAANSWPDAARLWPEFQDTKGFASIIDRLIPLALRTRQKASMQRLLVKALESAAGKSRRQLLERKIKELEGGQEMNVRR